MSCPFCDNPNRFNDRQQQRCILNQPLMMVIPPEGAHLSCPAHPEGHHVFGPSTYMSTNEYDKMGWQIMKKEDNVQTERTWSAIDMTYRPEYTSGGSLPQGF